MFKQFLQYNLIFVVFVISPTGNRSILHTGFIAEIKLFLSHKELHKHFMA